MSNVWLYCVSELCSVSFNSDLTDQPMCEFAGHVFQGQISCDVLMILRKDKTAIESAQHQQYI